MTAPLPSAAVPAAGIAEPVPDAALQASESGTGEGGLKRSSITRRIFGHLIWGASVTFGLRILSEESFTWRWTAVVLIICFGTALGDAIAKPER